MKAFLLLEDGTRFYGEPFGEMHALYVRRSQAEEGRK